VDVGQGENFEQQLLGRNLFYMIYGAKSKRIDKGKMVNFVNRN